MDGSSDNLSSEKNFSVTIKLCLHCIHSQETTIKPKASILKTHFVCSGFIWDDCCSRACPPCPLIWLVGQRSAPVLLRGSAEMSWKAGPFFFFWIMNAICTLFSPMCPSAANQCSSRYLTLNFTCSLKSSIWVASPSLPYLPTVGGAVLSSAWTDQSKLRTIEV